MNLQTGEEIVTRTPEFNAAVSADHVQQILDTYPERPILLFWDRAPWHSGDPISDLLAANPRLEIIKFPTATPDLNPQEYIWKQTRRAASYNHFVPKLPELADRFETHLNSNPFASSFLDRYGYDYICPFLN